MNSRQIKKLVKQKIEEGKSRTDVVAEIREETKADLEKIAKITKLFIPLQSRTKYNGLNTTLGILLVVTALIKLLAIFSLFVDANKGVLIFALLVGPAINVAMAVGVFKYSQSIYNVIIALSALGVVRSIGKIESFDAYVIFDYGLIAVIMGLSGFLAYKLNSGYEIKKSKYTAEDGTTKVKRKVVFNDVKINTGTLDEQI